MRFISLTALFIFLLLSLVSLTFIVSLPLASATSQLYVSNSSSGSQAFSCTSSACTPLPGLSPPSEKPWALSTQTNRSGATNIAVQDGTGASITAKFGYVYLVIYLNDLGLSDLNKITSINFTASGWSSTTSDPNWTAFTFNHATQQWVQCGSVLTGDINSIQQASCTYTGLDMVNQSNNRTYLLLQKSGNTANSASADALSINVSYNPIALSYVSPTREGGSFINRSTIEVNVSAGDSSIDAITIRLSNSSGALIRSNTSNTSPFSINYSSLADGFYTYNASANDTSGNVNDLATRNITIDTIFPFVSILVPPNNSNYSSSTLQINFSVSDLNLQSCWWTNSSGLFNRTFTCGTNLSLTWDEGINNLTFYANDSAGNLNHTSVKFRVDTISPSVSLLVPLEGQEFTTNMTVSLNFSITDSGSGVKTCWYNIDGTPNISIPGCTNTTFNTTEATHTIYLFANDTVGNQASDSNAFTISLSAPAITLLGIPNNSFLPYTSNIYLNWTATDPNGLGSCQVWHNINGSFALNHTKTGLNSGVMNFTIVNTSQDGQYLWNIFCTDALSNGRFSANNFTFTIDTTFPQASVVDLGTTQGSQTVRFNSSFVETNCNNSFYTVLNNSGGIENSLQNQTLTCSNMNSTFVVSDFSSYTLQVYVRDKAGNENLTSSSFSTTANPAGGSSAGGGGGGAAVTIVVGGKSSLLTNNYSIVAENFGKDLDFVLAKGSVKPRTKTLILINREKDPITVELVCDQGRNSSKENTGSSPAPFFDICPYVTFKSKTITISPNEKENTVVEFSVKTPEGAEFGDTYAYNILAIRTLDDSSTTFSKLSVTNRVTYQALIYKWAYLPLQGEKVELDRKSYPTLLPVLFLSTLLASLAFGISIKLKFPLAGFLVAVGLFIASFTALLLIL